MWRYPVFRCEHIGRGLLVLSLHAKYIDCKCLAAASAEEENTQQTATADVWRGLNEDGNVLGVGWWLIWPHKNSTGLSLAFALFSWPATWCKICKPSAHHILTLHQFLVLNHKAWDATTNQMKVVLKSTSTCKKWNEVQCTFLYIHCWEEFPLLSTLVNEAERAKHYTPYDDIK